MVAEALDRVSRDQADVAVLYKDLKFAGVMIVTLAEGEISDLHAALHGDLGTILEWAGGGTGKRATDTPHRGMSVSVVARAGFEPATFNLNRMYGHGEHPTQRSATPTNDRSIGLSPTSQRRSTFSDTTDLFGALPAWQPTPQHGGSDERKCGQERWHLIAA